MKLLSVLFKDCSITADHSGFLSLTWFATGPTGRWLNDFSRAIAVRSCGIFSLNPELDCPLSLERDPSNLSASSISIFCLRRGVVVCLRFSSALRTASCRSLAPAWCCLYFSSASFASALRCASSSCLREKSPPSTSARRLVSSVICSLMVSICDSAVLICSLMRRCSA